MAIRKFETGNNSGNVNGKGSCLHRAETLPLLLLPQLLLLQLLVPHASAAVKAAAHCMQPLAQYQSLRANQNSASSQPLLLAAYMAGMLPPTSDIRQQ